MRSAGDVLAGQVAEGEAAAPGGTEERKYVGLGRRYTKARGVEWHVRIRIDNKDVTIGYFKDPLEGASFLHSALVTKARML